MITYKINGKKTRLREYLTKISKPVDRAILEKYGEMGVAALKAATPIDTGLTANSWYYKVYSNQQTGSKLTFFNKNVKDGIPIAIVLQYGHATVNGGWIEGRDYINPALLPIFDKLLDDVWKEMKSK